MHILSDTLYMHVSMICTLSCEFGKCLERITIVNNDCCSRIQYISSTTRQAWHEIWSKTQPLVPIWSQSHKFLVDVAWLRTIYVFQCEAIILLAYEQLRQSLTHCFTFYVTCTGWKCVCVLIFNLLRYLTTQINLI
jgi:hypothetical protein